MSPLGRPLEFHCTSPVRPSRAQEILYGPTLQPYLLGEQISGALLEAAKLTPWLILTDAAAMLVGQTAGECADGSGAALTGEPLRTDASETAWRRADC